MTDAERIDALLDMVDPARTPTMDRGPELTILGLAVARSRGRYRPTSAGWVLLGDRDRAFQPDP